MRPVRLTMQAFGPFAGREVIDFRDAVASGLFGIYGQTGSGKSTIFSAMTFALFGEAAKAEQDVPSLRSDHADPAVPTEVEFIFDVGDRRYVVRRRPEQMRPKQRGTGERRDAHEAWLFDATGLAVEEISETSAGKIIAEKKVSVVREAVADLLGYGAEQFRQIVLLPQGKFEAFLAAKTDGRLAILRELFDISIYRRLSAKLKEDAATAERQVRQEREVCVGRLRAERFESPEALGQGIAAAQLSHEEETRREVEASRVVSDLRTKLGVACQLDEKFRAAEKAREDLDTLLQREAEVRALKQRVANARRAQALADAEGHLGDAETDLTKTIEILSEASFKATTAYKRSQLATKTLEKEQARTGEIETLRKKGDALERNLQTLAGAADLEVNVREATATHRKLQGTFGAAERRCNELTAQRQSKEACLRLSIERESERCRLTSDHTLLKVAYKDADDYEKSERLITTAQDDVNRLQSDHAVSIGKAEDAKGKFKTAETNLASAQALHLAAKLVPGEACPVCGSVEHPLPATGTVENSGLDSAFRDAKMGWERAQTAAQEIGRHLASAEATLKAREERLSDLPRPERTSADHRVLIEAIANQIQDLGPEIDIPMIEASVVGLAGEIAEAEGAREWLRGELQASKQAEAVASDRLQQALATVPDTLRTQKALNDALADNQDALKVRLDAFDSAEKAAVAARETSLALAKDAEAAVAAHTGALSRRDKARTAFLTRLAETGITEFLYQSYKHFIPMIDADMEKIEAYDKAAELARSNEELARQAITDFERPVLQPLEQAVVDADEGLKQATNIRAQTEARLRQLRNLLTEIEDALRRLEQIESETASLRVLAAIFNAENPQRLDLETFAIGAMFDQVLVAANQRLGPMTGGRYMLEREIEGSGGRARRGLGIRVFDVYTGKSRPPATLSGGETFIAALALALGLSEIVESVSGKVRLDTIFIDEGFGGLDTENESGTLDQVLQVLTNLVSQRRAVGLISHVPLVQEAIPNGFYVRKTVQGSRVEARGAI